MQSPPASYNFFDGARNIDDKLITHYVIVCSYSIIQNIVFYCCIKSILHLMIHIVQFPEGTHGGIWTLARKMTSFCLPKTFLSFRQSRFKAI